MTVLHQDGLLAVRARCDRRGRTVLAEQRQRFPLRMTVPMYLDDTDRGMAFIYVQNPTGAVFGGDRLRTDVVAGPGTRVHVTTQSASKLCNMDGGWAVQDLAFEVGEQAYLEYMPDPLIPQRGADYRQRTAVEVAAGGVFVGAEIVGPGRRAHGERFAYERVALTTEVRRDGHGLAVDAFELAPGRCRPDRRGLLGTHDYVASLVVAAPERDAERLAARLDAVLAGAPHALAAAGVLPGGAGVAARMLTTGPAAARALVQRAWAVVRTELLGQPAPVLRK